MYEKLETAPPNTALHRVVIEPVSRVEGHGKVTLLLDDERHVKQARLHIVEFRGFEKFIQGRPYWRSAYTGSAPLRHLSGKPSACSFQGDGFLCRRRSIDHRQLH